MGADDYVGPTAACSTRWRGGCMAGCCIIRKEIKPVRIGALDADLNAVLVAAVLVRLLATVLVFRLAAGS